jgi:hypothetical protein
VGNPLRAKKLARMDIGHQPLLSVHLTARITRWRICHVDSCLRLIGMLR